jgi:hypothetical protein
MNLILASPTYGPVQPQAVRAIRMAVMHAAARGVTWIGESSPDKSPIIYARQSAVTLALGIDCDGIMWIDDDMVPQQDAISAILAHDKKFISGYYVNRYDRKPIVAAWDNEKADFVPQVITYGAGLVEAGAAGFGFMFTHTSMLRKLKEPHFAKWRMDGPHVGEDLYFCNNARFHYSERLLIDTNLRIGHLGDPEVIL